MTVLQGDHFDSLACKVCCTFRGGGRVDVAWRTSCTRDCLHHSFPGAAAFIAMVLELLGANKPLQSA
jgi:hypothetical protein